MTKAIRTYRYRLYPTKSQIEKIDRTIERCRLLYNRLLAERQSDYKQYGKTTTMTQQSKSLPLRKEAIPELHEVYAQVLVDVVHRVDKAFQDFFSRKKGYPQFKSERVYNSFRYPQQGHGFNLIDDGRRLHLSNIGDVRIKLHRQPQGIIKNCIVHRKNGRYYACLACDVEVKSLPPTGRNVGIDVGLHNFIMMSDGQSFEPLKALRRSEDRLAKLQRQAAKKQKGSHRQKEIKSKIAKLHEHIANQRRDYAQKTSRSIIKNYDLIAMEDLKITNMIKNHRLAKSIADAGWNQLMRYIEYKAVESGRRVVHVDPRQTSQLCSSCGQIVPKSLAVRMHRCPHCGLVIDRDLNASINILGRATDSSKNE